MSGPGNRTGFVVVICDMLADLIIAKRIFESKEKLAREEVST